jgi:hypothetical protein
VIAGYSTITRCLRAWPPADALRLGCCRQLLPEWLPCQLRRASIPQRFRVLCDTFLWALSTLQELSVTYCTALWDWLPLQCCKACTPGAIGSCRLSLLAGSTLTELRCAGCQSCKKTLMVTQLVVRH